MTPADAMRRAVELSQRGFPAPNPHVGCILVRDGRVVGEGWHEYAGGPHAERVALDQAGGRARGATAYVTLEPCSHHGRTSPCTEALVAAGVERVVCSVRDPNPRAAGGLQRLAEAGIAVEHGLMAEEAEAANRRWLLAMRLGRPYVILKAAATLDGRIAREDGSSKWITGEAARERAHRLRAEAGVVLVGRGTVEQDNPHLTARIEGVRNPPLRVVLDPRATLTSGYRVFDDAAPTWHVTASEVPYADGFDLQALLAQLWARGETAILVEGGARTIASFLAADLADEIRLFLAPKLFGAGPAWVEGALDARWAALTSDPAWALAEAIPAGPDLELAYRRS